MGNITRTMDHYPRNKNPLATTLRQIVLNKNATSLVKNNTHTKTKERHNEILSLKSPDMFKTSNLTEG